MSSPTIKKLHGVVARREWKTAVGLLRQLVPSVVADFVVSLPYEEQRALFGKLPVDLAAVLVSHFPYYHAYVLLHSRPAREMRTIIDVMSADERAHFFDTLPEEAWQCLMDELSEMPAEGARPGVEAVEVSEHVAEVSWPAVAAEPIIVARQIEKRFQQPDGRQIQVIAPIDLSVEPDTVIALLGPSGSGKSTLLRMLSGLAAPSGGEVLWHGKLASQCSPNVAIVFQSFALFPWLTALDNVEGPLLARGMKHFERHHRALRALDSVGLKGFENAYPKELSAE